MRCRKVQEGVLKNPVWQKVVYKKLGAVFGDAGESIKKNSAPHLTGEGVYKKELADHPGRRPRRRSGGLDSLLYAFDRHQENKEPL